MKRSTTCTIAFLVFGLSGPFSAAVAAGLKIQLPPETATLKPGPGIEAARAQCVTLVLGRLQHDAAAPQAACVLEGGSREDEEGLRRAHPGRPDRADRRLSGAQLRYRQVAQFEPTERFRLLRHSSLGDAWNFRTAEQLMRALGLRGVVRGRPRRTTIADDDTHWIG